MTILELIKKALKEKGVNEKHAERVKSIYKIEKDDEVAKAVDAFVPIVGTIEAADAERKKAVEDAVKAAKAEAEQKAIADYEAKYKLKDGKAVDVTPPDTDPKGVSPEILDIIKNQTAQIEELKGMIEGSRKSLDAEKKMSEVKGLIKSSNLPESWANRVDIDSETSFEEQIKSLSDEYAEIQQAAINAKIESGNFSYAKEFEGRSEDDWVKIMNGDGEAGVAGKAELE